MLPAPVPGLLAEVGSVPDRDVEATENGVIGLCNAWLLPLAKPCGLSFCIRRHWSSAELLDMPDEAEDEEGRSLPAPLPPKPVEKP